MQPPYIFLYSITCSLGSYTFPEPWSGVEGYLARTRRRQVVASPLTPGFLRSLLTSLLFDHNINYEEQSVENLIIAFAKSSCVPTFESYFSTQATQDLLRGFLRTGHVPPRHSNEDFWPQIVADALNININIFLESSLKTVRVQRLFSDNSNLEVFLFFDDYYHPLVKTRSTATVIARLDRRIDRSFDPLPYSLVSLCPQSVLVSSQPSAGGMSNDTLDLDINSPSQGALPASSFTPSSRACADQTENRARAGNPNAESGLANCPPSKEGNNATTPSRAQGADASHADPLNDTTDYLNTTATSSTFDGNLPGDEYKEYFGSGKKFPTHLFVDTPIEDVDSIPVDIDGMHLYRMSTRGVKKISKLTYDHRYFSYSGSSSAGSTTKRRIGHCQGHFECPNDNCTKLKLSMSGKRNTTKFKFVKGVRTCFSCSEPMVRKHCGAKKMISVDPVKEEVLCYHLGSHLCTPRVMGTLVLQKADNDTALSDRHTGSRLLTPKQTQKSDILHWLEFGSAEKARAAAAKNVDIARIRNLKKKLSASNKKSNSMDAPAILKAATDYVDKLYVYRLNDETLTNEPDFVFMTSRLMMRIALMMDISDPQENPLQQEDVYFDGVHGRVVGMKALAAWVYHPAMRKVLRLATMYTLREDADNITNFWRCFNDALSEVAGKVVQFNPVAFMSDEAGANFQAVENVFGTEIRVTRCKGCQWHFKNNAEIHAKRDLPPEKREKFISLCGQMVSVATVASYESAVRELQKICEAEPQMKPFLEWWSARRYHIAPAFRRHGHTGVNLAEIGNSQWSPSHKLRLVDAMKDDLAVVMLQDEELIAFDNETGRSTGTGPTAFARSRRDMREQVTRAMEIATLVMEEGALPHEKAAMAEEQKDFFRPAKSGKHRPTKRVGVDGTWMKESPTTTPKRFTNLRPSSKTTVRSPKGKKKPKPVVQTGSVSSKSPAPVNSPGRKRGRPKKLTTQQVETPLPNNPTPVKNKRNTLDEFQSQTSQASPNSCASRKQKPRSRAVSGSTTTTKTATETPRRRGEKSSHAVTTTAEVTGPEGRKIDDQPIAAPIPTTSARERAVGILLQGTGTPQNKPASVRGLGDVKDTNPYVTMLHRRITRCQGCHKKIDTTELPEPYDMVFRIFGSRRWNDRATGQERTTECNNYFHLDFSCIKAFNPDLVPSTIHVDPKAWAGMTDNRLEALRDLGFLQHIVNNL